MLTIVVVIVVVAAFVEVADAQTSFREILRRQRQRQRQQPGDRRPGRQVKDVEGVDDMICLGKDQRR